MHNAGILPRRTNPVTKNLGQTRLGLRGCSNFQQKRTDTRSALLSFTVSGIFGVLTVVGILNPRAKAAAIITVVVVVNQQKQTTVSRRCKGHLIANQERLGLLPIRLLNVTDQSAGARRWNRTGRKNRDSA